MIWKKVHRIIIFEQSPWLKHYIDLNTELRAQAKSNAENDYLILKEYGEYLKEGRCSAGNY